VVKRLARRTFDVGNKSRFGQTKRPGNVDGNGTIEFKNRKNVPMKAAVMRLI